MRKIMRAAGDALVRRISRVKQSLRRSIGFAALAGALIALPLPPPEAGAQTRVPAPTVVNPTTLGGSPQPPNMDQAIATLVPYEEAMAAILGRAGREATAPQLQRSATGTTPS